MCQHNSTTTQQRVSKTAQQENKRAMNSRRQDFSTSVLTSVIQSVRQSVRTAVSTEVRQSDAFSGLQHPTGLFVLTGFVPDAGFGNGMIRLFRLAGEQAGTGRAIRPVFESPKHLCFGTRQAVFSVTRNRFRNRKQLARKGVENSSEVVAFYRAPRVPTRISILQNVFTLSARNLLHRSSETSRNKDKNKGQKAAPAKRTSDNSTQKKAVSTGDYCVKQRTGLRSNSSSQRTSSVLGRPSERRA